MNSQSPMSTVILAIDSGSRTILHDNPNLRGLTLEEFKKINIEDYRWIHFEGRNISSVVEMMEFVSSRNESFGEAKKVTVSVEVEKGREELLKLIPLADVVFIGKDFAVYRNCHDMIAAVVDVRSLAKPGSVIICPWGEQGAVAQEDGGEIMSCPAFPPDKVVDTLGAGDTFCASVINALVNNKSLQESITLGCQIAGAKVGMKGYMGLDKIYQQLTGKRTNNI